MIKKETIQPRHNAVFTPIESILNLLSSGLILYTICRVNTVGFGFSPNLLTFLFLKQKALAGCTGILGSVDIFRFDKQNVNRPYNLAHRRWGISPRPEGLGQYCGRKIGGCQGNTSNNQERLFIFLSRLSSHLSIL